MHCFYISLFCIFLAVAFKRQGVTKRLHAYCHFQNKNTLYEKQISGLKFNMI